MKVSPKVKKLLKDISEEAIQYSYSGDAQQKVLERYLDMWEKLDRKEKIYIMKGLYEMLHFSEMYFNEEQVRIRRTDFYRWIITTSLIAIGLTAATMTGFFWMLVSTGPEYIIQVYEFMWSLLRHIE